MIIIKAFGVSKGNEIRCCNCGKLLAEEVSIQSGFVKIRCKCGTTNKVEAQSEQKIIIGAEKLEVRLTREKREYSGTTSY